MSCLFDVGVDCQVVIHIISYNPMFSKSIKVTKSNIFLRPGISKRVFFQLGKCRGSVS